jgi:uncharacterized membrane protein YfcA
MDWQLAEIILLGFCAQLVDGALGMAYGVISTSFLLGMGLPPAAASASVHAAEVFTTGVSGLSHLFQRNVDRRLFIRLAITGSAGGVLGAYVLTQVPAETVKPFITVYLGLMGLFILWRAFRAMRPRRPERHVLPLGLAGGFLDAAGGGGWGPVVVSTLLAGGAPARTTIGSVNLAEFFVTASIAGTFIATIGFDHGRVILGLMIGGIVAAPLAAYLVTKIPERILMIAVATVVVALSIRSILTGLGWNPLSL